MMKSSCSPTLDIQFKAGLHIELEAHNPTHNMHRYYIIDVMRDLFGDWLITTRYGRIGQSGQRKLYGYSC
jgi:WGR domain.